ncbi:MAG: DUF6174 domain-containing protein [Acidimicrobiales bacterium]|nr:DUF6174 domain-containing protein [Acidimicrobiales bacterium]
MSARVGALLLAAVLVTSCGEPTSGVDASADIEAQRAGEVELDRTEVATRRRAWEAARPEAYAYDVEVSCDCPRAGTYSITVEGEEVLGVERHDADTEPYRLYSAPTIDEAFAMLDEPLAMVEGGEIAYGTAAAAFDPTFGYPTSWTVTGGGGLGSYRVQVHDFVPLEPAVIDRSPVGFELDVSNQSFGDPDVELTVLVDGQVIVDRSFQVEGQHTYVVYRVPLQPGTYDLRVSADSGAEHNRVLRLGPDRRYVYVSYWGVDEASAEELSVLESDEPFGFG